jgi:hypothetical protein
MGWTVKSDRCDNGCNAVARHRLDNGKKVCYSCKIAYSNKDGVYNG